MTNVQLGSTQLMSSSQSKISLRLRDVEKNAKAWYFLCYCFKRRDVAFLWCNAAKITATHVGVNLLELCRSSQTCRTVT